MQKVIDGETRHRKTFGYCLDIGIAERFNAMCRAKKWRVGATLEHVMISYLNEHPVEPENKESK